MTFDADHATRVRLAPSPPTEWRIKAACRGMSPSMFVVERGGDTSEAKAICVTCPVTTECLNDAVTTGDLGIRGGTSERDRRRIRAGRAKQKQVVATRPCGTTAAYRAHFRRDEPACPACKQAHAAQTAESKTPTNTRRRTKVGELRAVGMPNAEIAERVGRSIKWVEDVIWQDQLPLRRRGPQHRPAA